MLAKLTAKNQITIPKRALESLGLDRQTAYFEVEIDDGRIILTPALVGSADSVRRKLAELGLTESDVSEAVSWARRRS